MSVPSEAIEQYNEAIDAESELRDLMRDDIKFLSGDQWPDHVKANRERDQENGPRPCLTMDKLAQYVRQVVNDTRQNRPAIKIRAGEDGDTEVAGIIQGLTRNIEDVSRADIAYDRAIEHAAGPGRGWIRVNTRYSSPESFDQDIEILSIADPLSVVLGQYLEPDGSDAECGFVCSDIPKKKFERMYPKNTPSSFERVDGWTGDDIVRVAEYYKKTEEMKTLVRLTSGEALFEEDLDELKKMFPQAQIAIHDTREVGIPKIMWYKITSFDVLDETVWPGKWLPIVPVHGSEIWKEGKRVLSGLIRPGKDPQRLYNYSRSAFAELVALAPKAPFVMAEGQVEGYEDDWSKANRLNLPYLQYKPVDVAGHQVPPPQRQAFAGVPGGLMQDMVTAEHDIQSSIGMYAANIGQPSNERSGKAILARQREGDIGSYHYRDNLGRSIRHVGRIIVDLIPKVYDTRRVLRIVGEDGVDKQVTIDPSIRGPVAEFMTQESGIRKVYNPSLGQYDVSISTGPGYTTKREEAASAILQLTQNAPQLFGVVGDLLVKSMDWPYADEIARRLRLLLPPVLQQEAEGGEKPLPPQVQQKIVQMTQGLQLLQQKLGEIQQENLKLKGIVDGKVIDKAIKEEEAKVRMEELRVEELDIARQVEEIEIKRLEFLANSEVAAGEADLKRGDQEIKRRELGLKRDELRVRGKEILNELEAEEPEEPEDLNSKEIVLALQEIHQALQAVGEQVGAVESRVAAMEAPETREVERATQLSAIEGIVQGAQAAAVIPEYDSAGMIVGGTVIQRDGTKRAVNLRQG